MFILNSKSAVMWGTWDTIDWRTYNKHQSVKNLKYFYVSMMINAMALFCWVYEIKL